jgi:uncharacterized membrane protein
MNLAPLLEAPLAIQVHVATVVPAFIIGTWQIFLSRKGARHHRFWGYVYLALMTVTAIAAIFVQTIMPDGPFGGLSPIHLFVPMTLAGVAGAIYGVKTRNIRLHRYAMLGVYIGGILIAGAFTFVPGRIMHAVMFGT